MASDYEEGLLVGLLVGEGSFGGDGRQPQVTLRMHERHEALFRWLERTFPRGRLYGPYEHGGRRYYQWMARGPYLRDELLPLLLRRLSPALDRYAHDRLVAMCARYAGQLGELPHPARGAPTAAVAPPPVEGPGAPRDPRAIFAALRDMPGSDDPDASSPAHGEQ
ncbi:MAG TPA: hypothetical protein VND62_00360 [Acidimicrobiales bacterium]|nr:hypothetical protein [Acidimicrobiales bacterium]